MHLFETLVIIFVSNLLIQLWREIPKEDRNVYEDWTVETIDKVVHWMKKSEGE